MKNIAIYGGGWIHNMGNSFIQIGSRHVMEQLFPDANVHIIDGDPHHPYTPVISRVCGTIGSLPLLPVLKKPHERNIQNRIAQEAYMHNRIPLDAIVISGVWLTAKYLKQHMPVFIRAKENNTKVIMNGVGGTLYNQKEYEEVSVMLEKLQPNAIVTRDDDVLNAYRGRIPNIQQGIDVGFFVNDAFKKPFAFQKKNVACFDRGPIPRNVPIDEHTVITHHAYKGLRFHNYKEHSIFFSEMAEDYLNLYANAETTRSDRVHACVATLAFGNQAQLIDETPRAKLFDRVGAKGIEDDLLSVDMSVLKARKAEHLKALKSLL